MCAFDQEEFVSAGSGARVVDPRPPDYTEVLFLLGSEVPDREQCVSGAYVGALVEADKVVGGDLVLEQH